MTAAPIAAPSGRTRMRATTLGELFAEFLGTFVLILFGVGSVAVAVAGLPGSGRQAVAFGAANWLIIAFGWGFAVVLGVYVAGGVSGAHINPAITLAFAVRRRFPVWKVIPYWIAQVAGAFTAAILLYGVYHKAIVASQSAAGITNRQNDLGTFSIFATFPAPYFGGQLWGPFIDQIVGTAALVALVAALVDKRNQAPLSNIAPLIIGFVVVAIGLSLGTNAGYAINPARDFGPRLVTQIFGWGHLAFPGQGAFFDNYWWVPIAGPLIGGIVGILVYDFFIGESLIARARLQEAPEPGRVPGTAQEPEDPAARRSRHHRHDGPTDQGGGYTNRGPDE